MAMAIPVGQNRRAGCGDDVSGPNGGGKSSGGLVLKAPIAMLATSMARQTRIEGGGTYSMGLGRDAGADLHAAVRSTCSREKSASGEKSSCRERNRARRLSRTL